MRRPRCRSDPHILLLATAACSEPHPLVQPARCSSHRDATAEHSQAPGGSGAAAPNGPLRAIDASARPGGGLDGVAIPPDDRGIAALGRCSALSPTDTAGLLALQPFPNGQRRRMDRQRRSGVKVDLVRAEPSPHGRLVGARESLEQPSGHGESPGRPARHLAPDGPARRDGLDVAGSMTSRPMKWSGSSKALATMTARSSTVSHPTGRSVHELWHEVPDGGGREELGLGHQFHERRGVEDRSREIEGPEVRRHLHLGLPGPNAAVLDAWASAAVDELGDAHPLGHLGDLLSLPHLPRSR